MCCVCILILCCYSIHAVCVEDRNELELGAVSVPTMKVLKNGSFDGRRQKADGESESERKMLAYD